MQLRKLLYLAMATAGVALVAAGMMRGETLAPLGWMLTTYPLLSIGEKLTRKPNNC